MIVLKNRQYKTYESEQMRKLLSSILLVCVVLGGVLFSELPVQAKRISKGYSVKVKKPKTAWVKGYRTKKGKQVNMHYRAKSKRY